MKNAFWLSLLILLLGDVLYSCTKKNELNEIQTENKINQEKLTEPLTFSQLGLRLPAGSELYQLSGDKSRWYFRLPADAEMIATKADGTVASFSEGSVSCKCTQGSNCVPFRGILLGSDVVGCAMDGCTKCEQSSSGLQTEGPVSDPIIISMEKIGSGGIMDVFDVPTWKSLKSANSVIMNYPQVQQALGKYLSTAFSEEDRKILKNTDARQGLPANYQLLPVDMFGRLIYVPTNLQNKSSMTRMFNDVARYMVKNGDAVRMSTTYSCACKEGSGCNLKKGSIGLASAYYCETEGCRECELSWD